MTDLTNNKISAKIVLHKKTKGGLVKNIKILRFFITRDGFKRQEDLIRGYLLDHHLEIHKISVVQLREGQLSLNIYATELNRDEKKRLLSLRIFKVVEEQILSPDFDPSKDEVAKFINEHDVDILKTIEAPIAPGEFLAFIFFYPR